MPRSFRDHRRSSTVSTGQGTRNGAGSSVAGGRATRSSTSVPDEVYGSRSDSCGPRHPPFAPSQSLRPFPRSAQRTRWRPCVGRPRLDVNQSAALANGCGSPPAPRKTAAELHREGKFRRVEPFPIEGRRLPNSEPFPLAVSHLVEAIRIGYLKKGKRRNGPYKCSPAWKPSVSGRFAQTVADVIHSRFASLNPLSPTRPAQLILPICLIGRTFWRPLGFSPAPRVSANSVRETAKLPWLGCETRAHVPPSIARLSAEIGFCEIVLMTTAIPPERKMGADHKRDSSKLFRQARQLPFHVPHRSSQQVRLMLDRCLSSGQGLRPGGLFPRQAEAMACSATGPRGKRHPHPIPCTEDSMEMAALAFWD